MLNLTNIRKAFPGTIAADRVSLAIAPGEAVALVGENGAGKTTLMRIAAGTLRPDGGSVEAAGSPIRDAADAAAAGVAMVHQHFHVAGALTVAENLVLHDPSLPRFAGSRAIEAAARRMIDRAGLSLGHLDRAASSLSVGETSRLELIRALAREPRYLILDEPTSVLTPHEVDRLLATLRRLAAGGTAVVLVSHKLREVFAFARRIVVMRAGAVAGDHAAGSVTPGAVAREMIGRDLDARPVEHHPHHAGRARLRLEGVATSGRDHAAPLRGVSFSVAPGETAAIVGVAGNGQNALADLLRGIIAASDGRIEIDGVRARCEDLHARADFAHIPSDRTRDGIVHELTVEENLALPVRRRHARAEEAIARFGIRGRSDQPAGSLSGGNQQKLVLARELTGEPRLIIAAEPTRGLDVDAAAFVHARLREAAARGAAVVLITSDLDEASTLADAVHVISHGTLSERLAPETSAERLGLLMAGSA